MRSLLLAALVCLASTAGPAFAANVRAHDIIGTGVIVFKVDDSFVIKGIVPGSPAAGAGVKVNDRIIQVDNRDVEGLNISHLFDLLRGMPDTKVKVVVIRPGVPAPVTFTMIRKPVHVDSLTLPKTTD